MKRIKYIIFTTIIFLMGISSVFAAYGGSLSSIDMDISLDKNGNAHVTEKWSMNINAGTEVFKTLYNIGNMKVTDFSVTDEKGNEYSFYNNWANLTNFEAKKYRCGYMYASEGLELCWGISEYGKRTYTISYTINDFVFKTSDAQVIYFKLINGMEIMKSTTYTVTISGPEAFPDSLEVWGYGIKGNTYVADGKIEAINDEKTTLNGLDDYFVLLAKFEPGTFGVAVGNTYSQFRTFDDVLNKANEGTYKYNYSDYDDYNDNNDYNDYNNYNNNNDEGHGLSNLFDAIFDNFGIILVFGILVLASTAPKNGRPYFSSLFTKYKYGPSGHKIKMSEINNFRDIPCEGNIFRAYFLAKAYNLGTKDNDFIGSVFLKFINNGNVETIKETKKTLFKDKEVTSIKLLNSKGIFDEPEKQMYFIVKAASNDGILSQDEFTAFAKDKYERILNWFTDSEDYGRDLYIKDSSKVKFPDPEELVDNATLPKSIAEMSIGEAIKHSIDDDKEPKKKEQDLRNITLNESPFVSYVNGRYLLHDKMRDEAVKLAGLKKYLIELTNMKEKEAIEVKLWKEYLMFASIFGIADKVAEQFKNLYPEISIEMEHVKIDGYDIARMINFGRAASVSASSAYSEARSAASSYRSGGFGGGGWNSGGGGGGSFGGGGGGGFSGGGGSSSGGGGIR